MSGVPPIISPPAANHQRPLFISLGVALTVAATVFLFNPATSRFYPACLFHRLTGLNCPGCGMTRALYALLHGNLLVALQDNALFTLGLGLLGLRGGWFTLEKKCAAG